MKIYTVRNAKCNYVAIHKMTKNGKQTFKYIPRKELTTRQLVAMMKQIIVFGGGIMPEVEEENGYTVINEAIKRLNKAAKMGII